MSTETPEAAPKTLADFETQTPRKDREVTIYDAEGEIKHFWGAKSYGNTVVVTHRRPGKHPKLVSIEEFHDEWSADHWIDATATEREKRVPIIRKEKATAKLDKLIEESGAPIEKLTLWAKFGSSNLFESKDEVVADNPHCDWFGKPRQEQLDLIIEALRRKGDSYFGALKLARHFISQIKPGGLADQAVQGVRDLCEKNLIPWAFVAGYLHEKVMMANEPRPLAIKLIEKLRPYRYEDLNFYPEGTTAEGIVSEIDSRFVKGFKPDVLDALTLD